MPPFRQQLFNQMTVEPRNGGVKNILHVAVALDNTIIKPTIAIHISEADIVLAQMLFGLLVLRHC